MTIPESVELVLQSGAMAEGGDVFVLDMGRSVKIKDLIFASTGVIGEQFPVEKIKDAIPHLVEKLKKDHNKLYWLKIASAMMTTDTKPKLAYEEIIVGDEDALKRIYGVKGAAGLKPCGWFCKNCVLSRSRLLEHDRDRHGGC